MPAKAVLLLAAVLLLGGCASPALRCRVRDLEMENAALREANAYLRPKGLTMEERVFLMEGRMDLLEMQRLRNR